MIRSVMKGLLTPALPLLALLPAVFLAACSASLLDPPRLATMSAQDAVTPTSFPAIELPAPTPTGPPLALPAPVDNLEASPTLIVWGLDRSDADSAALNQVAADFAAESGINVELFLVQPDLLSGLMHTAVISSVIEMPHVVMLPLEYTAGWADQGILDSVAAAEVVDALGSDTFNQDALALVANDAGFAAVPSDGWQQLLVYRRDLFERLNLAPPATFDAMIAAGQVISDSTALIAGFNMPTESSQLATTRMFEQLALADGCRLIDEEGELQILGPACQEAFEFYRFLCNSFCPPGVQTEISANNSYLSGRVGMILTSPAILAQLAGLEPVETEPCPECNSADYLARNSGIITQISGRRPGTPAANLGNVTYLGITRAASAEAGKAFVQYWFEEGYMTWLAANPEMKVPMRHGTASEPELFLNAWRELPLRPGSTTFVELFGEEVVGQLTHDVVNESRWGFGNGQGVLLSEVYESLMLSVLLQELLSGYYTSDRAAIEGYKRLVDMIPDYAYYVDPEPTPEPEP